MARPRTEIEPVAEPAAASTTWRARPVLAWLIRTLLVVTPLLVSWLAVHVAIGFVERPRGVAPTAMWIGAAFVLSTAVYVGVRRMLAGVSPLGVLYTLSLTFPDAAPSRMRAAFRSRRAEEVQQQLGGDGGSLEPRMKAKRLADLVTAVSRREVLTRGHSDRVRGYAELIGEELGLDDDELHRLRWATLLHDVGLLDVPARILDTRGPLDRAARDAVEQHPVHAVDTLAPFGDWLGPWARAATDHHERWDGTGYPDGLAGEQISLAGRIVAVADAYDAMTATRSYRKPISPAAARQELVDNAGTQFDPAVVRAFLNVGIRESRAGIGPLAALVELPSQLLSLAPGAAASAGVAAAGAAVVAATVVPAVVSADVELPPAVERVVEAPPTTTVPTTTQAPPTTLPRATTTRLRPATTTATTTTTTTTTTRVAPTAPPTTAAPTTTAPPTTAPTTTAAPTTTTVAAYPTVPTVPPTTTPPVTYPTVGP